MQLQEALCRLADGDEAGGRCEALEALRQHFSGLQMEQGEIIDDESQGFNQFACLLADPDPRVRARLIEIWGRAADEAPSSLDWLERALEDEDARVRSASMRFLLSKCQQQGSSASLHCWAFSKLCERVNDIDRRNRVLACDGLGKLALVEEEVLLRAFDKAGPRESDWCAAGAFIIALEDQYALIRSTIIRSIFKISLVNRRFADAATDFIIDTFNDESDGVRLVAIRTLYGICLVHRVSMGLGHLESTLCLLDDANEEIRVAVRQLLQVAHLGDDTGADGVECLLRTLRCLHVAWVKFPREQAEIVETIAKIGQSHPDLVLSSLKALLPFDRFYLIPEPRLDDLFYNAKAVVVLNALAVQPDMASFLPPFLFKQFPFFRAKFGKAVPSFRGDELQGMFYKISVDTAGLAKEVSLAELYSQFNKTSQGGIDVERFAKKMKVIEAVGTKIASSHARLLRKLAELVVGPLIAKDTVKVLKGVKRIREKYYPLSPCILVLLEAASSATALPPLEFDGNEEILRVHASFTQPQSDRSVPMRGITKFPLRLDFALEVENLRPIDRIFVAADLGGEIAVKEAGNRKLGSRPSVFLLEDWLYLRCKKHMESPKYVNLQAFLLLKGVDRIPETAEDIQRDGVRISPFLSIPIQFKDVK